MKKSIPMIQKYMSYTPLSVEKDDNEHLVGIFTWIDALKATNILLETRLNK